MNLAKSVWTRSSNSDLSLREFTAVAKWPFLALAPRSDPITYQGFEHGKPFRLSVSTAEPTLGLATVADDGILIWAASELTARLNAGQPLRGVLEAQPNDILRRLGRLTGGRQRQLLENSVRRLQATAVATDLAPQGQRRTNFFSLVETFERPPAGQRGVWRIGLSGWFIEQIEHRQILKLDPSALPLQGLHRRLSAWGRAHAARRDNDAWKIAFDRAYAKSASLDAARKFRHALRAAVAEDRIPGFHLALEHVDGAEALVIARCENHSSNTASRRPETGLAAFTPNLTAVEAPTEPLGDGLTLEFSLFDEEHPPNRGPCPSLELPTEPDSPETDDGSSEPTI